MSFRLVPNSVTLDNVCKLYSVAFGADYVKEKEEEEFIRQVLQQ